MARLVLSRRMTRSSVVSEGKKSRIGAEAGKHMSCSMRGRALHLCFSLQNRRQGPLLRMKEKGVGCRCEGGMVNV